MNRTTTSVQLWRIDCEAFRKVGSSFELRDVTSVAHEAFVDGFTREHRLTFARNGTTVTFFPAKRFPVA